MLLFRPRASPAIVAVKGSPEESCSTVPICQPCATARNGPHADLGLGNSQVALIAKLRGVSKSDGALISRESKIGRLEIVFV